MKHPTSKVISARTANSGGGLLLILMKIRLLRNFSNFFSATPDSDSLKVSSILSSGGFMNARYFKPGTGPSRVILLGSIYLLLGIFALAFASATTLTAIITLGLVLIFMGIAEIVYGVQGRKRGQLWPHVSFGCLGLICGVLILINPIDNVLGFTLVAGFFLIANGMAKVIGALAEQSSGWGWYASNGVLSMILGGLILRSFPISAFWTIGVFVSIDLIISGASLIGLGASAKRARKELVGQMYSTLHPEPEARSESEKEERPLH